MADDGLMEMKCFIEISVALQNIVRCLDRTAQGKDHKQRRLSFLRGAKETAYRNEVADYQDTTSGKMIHATKHVLKACEISDDQWEKVHEHFMSSATSRTLVE